MDGSSGHLASNPQQILGTEQYDNKSAARCYQCAVCQKQKLIYDVRRCAGCPSSDNENTYYCYRSHNEEPCKTRDCPEDQDCWQLHLPQWKKLHSQHKPMDPVSDLFVDLVTYSEPNEERHRELHQRDEASRWFQVIQRDFGSGPTPYIQVTDRFRQLCNPGMLNNDAVAPQYPGFVSFIGETSAGKSTLIKAMLLMGHLCFTGDEDEERPKKEGDESGDAEARQKVEQLERDASSSGRFPVTRSSNINNIIDPTSLGVNLYKDVPPPHSPETYNNVQTPMMFADCEGLNAGMAKTSTERSRSPSNTHSSRNVVSSQDHAQASTAGTSLSPHHTSRMLHKQPIGQGTRPHSYDTQGMLEARALC